MNIKRLLLLLISSSLIVLNAAQKQSDTRENLNRVAEVLNTIDFGRETGPNSFHAFGTPDKHVPFLEMVDRTHVALKVMGAGGSKTKLHPQTSEHHISKVWVVNEFTGEIIFFADISEREEASVVFEIKEGMVALLPNSYCNLHGLFEGDPFQVELMSNFESNTEHLGL